jgi:multidrug efflux pump subunit AcrA (membrane-fusion protein)
VKTPPPGTGEDVLLVGPEDSTDRVALHGFELSIALMLDGKRTARDVILNCERVGIPLDVEQLDAFVHHLKRYGLLAGRHPDSIPPRGRARWSSPERALYRSALHDARGGAVALARDELKELLSASPDATEAKELLDWLEANDRGEVTGMPQFEQTVRDVERGWLEDDQPHVLQETARRLRRAPGPLIGLAAGAGLLVVGLLIPLPRIVATSAELTPGVESPVLAPHPGTVGEVLVHEGDLVEEGAPLFNWNVDAAQVELAGARERLDADREVVRAQLAQTPAGAAPYERLLRAEAELTRARTQLLHEQKDYAGTPPSEAAVRAEERFDKARAEVDAAGAALDALNPGDSTSAMSLEGVALDVRRLEQEAKERAVEAPAAGVVNHLFLTEGQQVGGEQKLLQIDDVSRLKVRAVLTPRTAAHVQLGDPLTLRFGDTRVATTVEAVSGYEIAAEISNPGGSLKVGNTLVDLELSPRSIIDRLRE